MKPRPEERFDPGEADEVFDSDVEGLPQMPPQDDVGWLRTPRSRGHGKTGASKPAATPRPRQKGAGAKGKRKLD